MVSVLWIIGGAVDRVREKCQLMPRTSRHLDHVRLVRISEPRPDGHFPPRRVPVRLKSIAIFRVAPDLLRQRRRNAWHISDTMLSGAATGASCGWTTGVVAHKAAINNKLLFISPSCSRRQNTILPRLSS